MEGSKIGYQLGYQKGMKSNPAKRQNKNAPAKGGGTDLNLL
jgi:hypothetical protein